MATSGKVKGVTIEFNGDTTPLDKALKSIRSSTSKLTSELKTINRQLKFDPTNTELLKQKTEVLNQTYEAENKKLKDLQDAQKQLQAEADSGSEGAAEALRKVNREIESTKSYIDELKKQGAGLSEGIITFAANAEEAGKKVKAVGEGMTKVGEGLSKSVTAPIMAIGGASIAAFNEVDAGMDTIVQKTGASGEALEDMQNRAQNLATTIPTDFETAGAAVGEVNTRFGLTGDALEDLSGQFIKFASLNNTDVSSSIDSVQKAMDAFGLQAEDASGFLDTLNAVGQNTGISMDSLTSLMTTNATAFQELGLGASDAANLLGTLEKSGIDTSTVMTGLKKAQAEAAKEGTDMSTVLEQAFSSSGDAVDIFGSKAGPQLYAAMQNGVISLDDFTASADGVNDSVGSVSDTFDTTLDPIDQWQLTLNQLKITGAQLGNSIMTILQPVLQKVQTVVQSLTEKWNGLSEEQQQNIIKMAGIAAAAGPVIAFIGKLTTGVGGFLINLGKLPGQLNEIKTGVGTLQTFASGAIKGIGTLLAGPMGPIIIIGAIIAILVTLYNKCEWFRNMVNAIWKWIQNNILQPLISFFTGTLPNAINAAINFFRNLWNAIVAIFAGVGSWFTARFREAYNGVVSVFQGIGTWFTARYNDIKNVFTSVGTWFTNKFKEGYDGITKAFDGIGKFFSDIWDDIKRPFENVGTWFSDKFKAAADGIRNAFSGLSDFLGGIIGKADEANTKADTASRTSRGRYYANGGTIASGDWGIVAEAGPELIRMAHGEAVITPLTNASRNTLVGQNGTGAGGGNFIINQTNVSPKAMDASEVYRETRKAAQLTALKIRRA